jgi:hypothetical protein
MDSHVIAADLAGLRLTALQFYRLAAECSFDLCFPSSFDAWQALIAMGDQATGAGGSPAPELWFEVEDFIAWCRRAQVQPGLDALRAFAIYLRRRTPSA